MHKLVNYLRGGSYNKGRIGDYLFYIAEEAGMSVLMGTAIEYNKILVEWGWSDDTRRYVVSKLISRSDRMVVKRPIPIQKSDARKLGPIGVLFASMLLGIEGVAHIEFSPHDVLVVKGRAFDWSQVHDNVIFALALIFDNELPFLITYAEEVRARQDNPDKEIEILTEALTLYSSVP